MTYRRIIIAAATLVAAGLSCAMPSDRSESSSSSQAAGAACKGVTVRQADIGGPLGLDPVGQYHVLVDSAADKVLVVGTDSSRRPTLRRCNADGTGCTAHLLDPNRGADSAVVASAALDLATGMLLVVTEDKAWSNPRIDVWEAASRTSLFRCKTDGTGCTVRELPHDASMPFAARILVDERNSKLLVPGCQRMLRCERDGASCAVVDLVGSGPDCGDSYAIDAASRKLVFTQIAGNAAGPGTGDARSTVSITRCDLDGRECETNLAATLHAPSERLSGVETSLAVDAAQSKLVVVYNEIVDATSPLGIVRCDLDGSGCTNGELPGSVNGWRPRLEIANDELVVAEGASTLDPSLPNPSLLRCAADGSACTRTELPAESFGVLAFPELGYDRARANPLVAIGYAPAGYAWPEGTPVALFSQAKGAAAVRTNISGGLPATKPFDNEHSVLDRTTGKVITLAMAAGPSRIVTTCDADGSQCTAATARRAYALAGTIDGVAYLLGKETDDDGPAMPVELVRCAPGATACTGSTLAGATTGSELFVDAKHRRIIDVNQVYDSPVITFRFCSLDGVCGEKKAWDYGTGSELAFDDVNDRLLVTSGDGKVHVCARDVTGCRMKDVAPTSRAVRWLPADILVGERSFTLFATEVDAATPHLPGSTVVYECKLDATDCSRHEIFSAETRPGFGARATLDTATNKLFVAYTDRAHLYRPVALRCETNGRACCELDIGVTLLPRTGIAPIPLFDAASGRSLVVTIDETNLGRARLFSLSPGLPSGGGNPDGGTDAGGGDGNGTADAGNDADPTRDAGGGIGDGGGGGGKAW